MNPGGDEGRALIELARASVRHGLEHGKPLADAGAVGGALAQPGACFVSLHIGDGLRGCIGRTEASPRRCSPCPSRHWPTCTRSCAPAQIDAAGRFSASRFEARVFVDP